MFRYAKGVTTRWIAEMLVIAVGVFLGITAESLWQEQIDRREERQHLIALREDFTQSLRLLDAVESNQKLQVDYIESLLQGKAASVDPIVLRDWVRIALYNLYRYEPQLSALRDLELSGDMQLIQDSEIRRGLAKLRQQMSLYAKRETDIIDTQKQYIDAFLLSDFDLSTILELGESSFPGPDISTAIDSSIFESLELRSALAFKLSQRNQLSEDQVTIRSQMEHLMALIQERIGPQPSDLQS